MLFDIRNKEHVEYIILSMFNKRIEIEDFDNVKENIVFEINDSTMILPLSVVESEMDMYNRVKIPMVSKIGSVCLILDDDTFSMSESILKHLSAYHKTIDIIYEGNFYYLNERESALDLCVYDHKNYCNKTLEEMISMYIEETGNINFIAHNIKSLDLLKKHTSNIIGIFGKNTIDNYDYIERIYNENDLSIISDSKIRSTCLNGFGKDSVFVLDESDTPMVSEGILVYLNSFDMDRIKLILSAVAPIGLKVSFYVEGITEFESSNLADYLNDSYVSWNLHRDSFNNNRDLNEISLKEISYKHKIIFNASNSIEVNDIIYPLYGKEFKIMSMDNILNQMPISENTHYCKSSSVIEIIKSIISLYGDPFNQEVVDADISAIDLYGMNKSNLETLLSK